MKRRSILLTVPLAVWVLAASSHAQTFKVTGGTTSVALDTGLLASAASLTLTSANSTGTPFDATFAVGFPILESTSFTFNTEAGFTPLGGMIEHSGTVTFNGDSPSPVTVGDFSIGFDAARALGAASGFFVADTAAGLGILFDIGTPGGLMASSGNLIISGSDLLVAPEFGAFLFTNGLSASDLTGADVGDARVDATYSSFGAVPEPSTYALGGLALLVGVVAWKRSRRSTPAASPAPLGTS